MSSVLKLLIILTFLSLISAKQVENSFQKLDTLLMNFQLIQDLDLKEFRIVIDEIIVWYEESKGNLRKFLEKDDLQELLHKIREYVSQKGYSTKVGSNIT
jgi:hypothetical protein